MATCWFGTQYGLNRYDGYRFRTYRHQQDDPDSLSSSAVTDFVAVELRAPLGGYPGRA